MDRGRFILRLVLLLLIHCIACTVVPALGDPRREQSRAVYGNVSNVPTHFNVPIRPSDERPPAMYGHFCLVPGVSVHDRYYCTVNTTEQSFTSECSV